MIYPMYSANVWFLGDKGFHITIGHDYFILDIFGTDLWNEQMRKTKHKKALY